MLIPRVLATIFIEAQLRMNNRWSRIPRNYDCHMSLPRHHRICAIVITLACGSRMSMYISNDGKLTFTTNCPELGECVTMENTDSRAVCIWIEFFIKNDIPDSKAIAGFLPEQKCSRLVTSVATDF